MVIRFFLKKRTNSIDKEEVHRTKRRSPRLKIFKVFQFMVIRFNRKNNLETIFYVQNNAHKGALLACI